MNESNEDKIKELYSIISFIKKENGFLRKENDILILQNELLVSRNKYLTAYFDYKKLRDESITNSKSNSTERKASNTEREASNKEIKESNMEDKESNIKSKASNMENKESNLENKESNLENKESNTLNKGSDTEREGSNSEPEIPIKKIIVYSDEEMLDFFREAVKKKLSKRKYVKKMTERLAREIFYLNKMKTATLEDLDNEFGFPFSTLFKDLKILKESGYIYFRGNNRNRHYEISEKMMSKVLKK